MHSLLICARHSKNLGRNIIASDIVDVTGWEWKPGIKSQYASNMPVISKRNIRTFDIAVTSSGTIVFPVPFCFLVHFYLLFCFSRFKYLYNPCISIESDKITVMDLLAWIYAFREICHTWAAQIRNGCTAFGIHFSKDKTCGLSSLIFAPAEIARPSKRASAAWDYQNLSGETFTLMNMTLFKDRARVLIYRAPSLYAVWTYHCISFYDVSMRRTALNYLIHFATSQ